LFPAERIREAAQRLPMRAKQGTREVAVIKQGIAGCLQSMLFAKNHQVWCVNSQKALQAVVAVNNTAVEFIDIRGREAPAIEGKHRAQIRREYWDYAQYHPLRFGLRASQGFDHF